MNKIYSAKKILITATPVGWEGPSLILNDGAVAAGTFAEIAMAADESTMTATMENGGVLNLLPGTNGTISVTLVASAVHNNALSDARRYQKKEGSPRAWALQLKDAQGYSLFSCPFAGIQGAPTATYSETVPMLTWVFLCLELDMDHRESNNLGVANR
jgi:hypothetical protein